MRNETEEQKKARMMKRAETAAKQAELKAHVLSVGPWRIYRIDAYNIAMEKQGAPEDARCYYPDFHSALVALQKRISEPAAKADLSAYMETVRKSEDRILKACAAFVP